jgi:membrane glycosyltransferase
MDFRQSVSDPGRIFYRNRRENVERKTGNIADFCAGWGGRYRYMIVFDADSIMTGTCLVNLVRLMESHPNAGIVQAPPSARQPAYVSSGGCANSPLMLTVPFSSPG